jgi:hypothetical protein
MNESILLELKKIQEISADIVEKKNAFKVANERMNEIMVLSTEAIKKREDERPKHDSDATVYIDRAIEMLKEMNIGVAGYNGVVSLLGYAKQSHRYFGEDSSGKETGNLVGNEQYWNDLTKNYGKTQPYQYNGRKCVAGCKNFDHYETKHHPDCPFYKGSLSEMYDKQSVPPYKEEEKI